MLELKKGCFVTAADELEEGWELDEYAIYANVNTGKITNVMAHYLAENRERSLFFILELPSNVEDEKYLRKSDSDPMHKDVYYIDGLSAEKAAELLDSYGELMIQDGLCRFGFGTHDGTSEIMSDKYNVITIWAQDIGGFSGFFAAHGIPQAERLRMAWDTFTAETPGECRTIKINGMDIYALPDELAKWGIYLAEQRED